MLRSYDPQIGRFLQNDPYDQFASGYVGMGNDPVNGVDPTGGIVPSSTYGNFINNINNIVARGAPTLTSVISIGAKTGINAGSLASKISTLASLALNGAELGSTIGQHKQDLRLARNISDKNSTYLVFDGSDHILRIYSNNGSENLDDDELLGEYDAYNNVDKSSNGKWEDGEYVMEDQTGRHLHSKNKVDKYGIPVDSEDGMYGEGGIYRAKAFKGNLFTRSGMAIHSGRLHWTKGKNKGKIRPLSTRVTMGCIRVNPSTMNAIDDAIREHGKLKRIFVLRNRNSVSSQKVNNIIFNKTQSNNIFYKFFNWVRKIISTN